MASSRVASRVWWKPSLRWSWSRLPLCSYSLPNLSNFSLNICPNYYCRFPTPPLLSLPSNPSSFNPRLTSSVHARLFSPLDKWLVPSGPLFLSSPTWQLSQLATPLYPPGKFVFRGNEWEGEQKQTSCQQRLDAFVKKHLAERVSVFGTVGRWPVAGAEPVCNPPSTPFDGVLKSEFAVPDTVSVNACNLPNAISMARMLSGPLLGWMILNEQYYPAFVGLLFAGASDWLDGFVARKLRINSVLGSYLDPLADKVLISCVALSMIESGLLHPALVALVVSRDCTLVVGAFYKRAESLGWQWKGWRDFFNVEVNGAEKVDPLLISKVNTVLQLALVGTALLQPGSGAENSFTLVTWLSWSVAATTLASWAGYAVLLLQKGSQTSIKSSQMFSNKKAAGHQQSAV